MTASGVATFDVMDSDRHSSLSLRYVTPRLEGLSTPCHARRPVRRLLFEVHLYTQFRELLRVAKLVAETGRYACTFCLTDATAETRDRIELECRRAGFSVVKFELATPQVRSRYLERARAIPIGRRLHDTHQALRAAEAVLRAQAPALIVMGEDGMGANRAMVTIARRWGIPMVVIPYEYSTVTQPAQALRDTLNYHREYGMETWLNRAVARLFPQWIHTYRGERLLRGTAATVLVEELLGLAPQLPWTVHGGWADRLAAESAAMRDHYLREGVSLQKISVTGAIYHDELRRNMERRDEVRRALARALDFDPDRRILLCALPPSYVRNRPQCDFASYAALLGFWVDTMLRLEQVTVLFQLHPAIAQEEEAELSALGAKICREDIATLIPACDALITSVSSIIRMAIACGTPVLNYDVYRFAYPDYERVPGVVTVQEREDFVRVLRSFATHDELSVETSAQQGKCALEWGILDGRAGERVLALFDELSEPVPPQERNC